MVMREQDKHFLWSLYIATAIIFTWKGLWTGVYEIPYVDDPFIWLFVGFTMLTLSGVIFREFDPLGGLEKAANAMIQFVHAHPQKQEFTVIYRDQAQKKNIAVGGEKLKAIEKGTLVIRGQQEEIFIPIHRVTEILYQGKRYWRF